MDFKLYCFLFTGLLIFNETIQHDEIKCFHGKRDFFHSYRKPQTKRALVRACVSVCVKLVKTEIISGLMVAWRAED